jgi:hypothetical protein
VKVLTHADSVILERELLARVDAAHPRGTLARTLILAPTSRLVAHVQRRLAERRPAWLGLEVLTFPALARRVLEERGGRGPQVVSSRLLEALLGRLLDARPGNAWSRLARERPGTTKRLRAALNDLREAGLDPAELAPDCAAEPRGADLVEIYRDYHLALERRGSEGWTDEAGLIRAALPGAATFGRGCRAVFLHGAYELIGVHLELLRRLARETEVTALLPGGAGRPVAAYAERFAREFLGAPVEALGAEDAGRLPLDALFDESARPAPAPVERLAFCHVQGAAAEVELAAREALAEVERGCPPSEIVLVARTLEPFAAAIEAAFEDEGLPYTSSVASPLRRHPVVRDFVLLLQVVDERYPRRATAELLRSRRMRWSGLGGDDAPPRGDRADLWSRSARLVGGLEEWTRDLPRWAAQAERYPGQSDEERLAAEAHARGRAVEAQRIARSVESLERVVDPAARTWSEHAARLEELLESRFLRPDDGPASQAFAMLEELLGEMRRLETLVGDRDPVPFHTMCEWLQHAVDGAQLTLRADDNGGIRVLDAMQLRGLTFRRTLVLGLNGGLFPRTPREDPVLPDRLRARLRERTKRPLGVAREGRSEERLLLAMVLGSASERVTVSWQRADEAGKARTPSLALRELARLALGRPDLPALRERSRHVPSHPEHWRRALVEGTGLLAPGGERVLAALQPKSAAALGGRFPELEPGFEMIRNTQVFFGRQGAYDARIGPFEPRRELSVSALETLGSCPLRFFFERVVAVRSLDEPASLFDIEPREIGTQIHALLETIYARLRDEGRFDAADEDAEPVVRRAHELLELERGRILGELDARLSRRLPVLHARLSRNWVETLRGFLSEDLTRLVARRARPVALEESRLATVDFGEGLTRRLRGRFDRRVAGPQGERVGDYKTGPVTWRVNPNRMLKAETLQVPLYWMLAGGDAEVELLAVTPAIDPAAEEAREVFAGFDGELRDGFRHTMRVLLGLLEAGAFPYHEGRHCTWCPYDRACRRNHPPTEEREERSADGAAYRALADKNRSHPHGRPDAR